MPTGNWQICFAPIPIPDPLVTLSGRCKLINNCISSSNIPYDHNEGCHFHILKDALVEVKSFEIEVCCDHFDITGDRFGKPELIHVTIIEEIPILLFENDDITWTTDESIAFSGWEICFSEIVTQTFFSIGMKAFDLYRITCHYLTIKSKG